VDQQTSSPVNVQPVSSTPSTDFVMQVKEVARAVAFCTRRLGFTLKYQQLPAFANLSLDSADVLLSGPGASGITPDGEWPTSGIGGLEPHRPRGDRPARLHRRPRAGRGDVPQRDGGWPGGRQIQIEDPDGNPLELFEPTSRS
jgi:glyoxylase I family protein